MHRLPSTMKALFGENDALSLKEIPLPVLQAGEVLIKVHAAALNRADLLQRKGKYDPPPGASHVMGMECAGEVVALGPQASRFKIGDRVMALVAGGAQAEFCAAPEAQCLPIPKNLSLVDASAVMEAIATVWANVFEGAAFKAGETALIHGGSSGIGTFAIQMVKAFGGRSVVTVSSKEKAEACLKLGAAHAILYNEQDFVKEALAFTNNHGVDVVLDMIGGDYVNRNLEALAKYGRHVSIATQKGAKAEIDIRLVMKKHAVITGSTLRARESHEKARIVAALAAHVLPKLAAGEIKPVIYQGFPLEKAGEAHKVMETSRHIGKITLTVC